VDVSNEALERFVTRYARYFFVFIFFLIFVDGAIPQAQMLLFSGRIIIPAITFKVLLFLLLVFSLLMHFLRSGTVILPTGLVLSYYLFVTYLIIHFLVLIEEYPPDYLLFSYNSYYFFLLALPLAVYVKVRAILVEKWFVIISIPIIALGMVQYLSNSPILPVASVDQSFKVYVIDYYGKTRAFSLFNSGLNYGHFLSIAGGLCVVRMVRSRKLGRLKNFAIFAVEVFACYTTLTRNLYVEFTFTVCAALLLSRQRRTENYLPLSNALKYLPVIYGAAALLLVTGTQAIMLYVGGTSLLLKQESLLMRYMEWKYYFPLWTGQGLKTLLFGVGLIQNERFPVTEEVLLDNTFLAIGLHIGLIGVVLWFIFMWGLWKHLLAIWKRMPDNAILIAFIALWSTWISSGIYNINFSLYSILALIMLSIYRTEKSGEIQKEKAAKPQILVAGTDHL
jgi:hypothetical protein